jgi:hypothetical protein
MAHVGGVPVEELAPVLAAAGAGGLSLVRVHLRRLVDRLRSRP